LSRGLLTAGKSESLVTGVHGEFENKGRGSGVLRVGMKDLGSTQGAGLKLQESLRFRVIEKINGHGGLINLHKRRDILTADGRKG